LTIAYRHASIADWSAIDRLFRTAFCDTFAHLYAHGDLEVFLAQFTEAEWCRELEDDRYAFRICEDGEEPVGYVKLGPSALPIAPRGPAIELRQLYLLKPWHGQGIADQLMQWALGEARDRRATEMYLTVYTDNHRARRFYERYGFAYLGPYRFMVGQHADEDIIMRLAL
jgi:GNAT superfamily N-acetyltransferase